MENKHFLELNAPTIKFLYPTKVLKNSALELKKILEYL